MLSYLFHKKKKNGDLYTTFKHYNTKRKKQINKKEQYCTRKARVMSLI